MDLEKIVNYDEMKTYQHSDEVLLIDVRKEEEIENTGKIEGAINIPSKAVATDMFSVA